MIIVPSEQDMQSIGEHLGSQLQGGDVIELIGDVGAGKTTLVRGLAKGMGIDETIQSPSFAISRVYDSPAKKLRLAHYDFYRLSDPGIMTNELHEAIHDDRTVVVIEWAGAVLDVLPDDHLKITISSPSEQSRNLTIVPGGDKSTRLAKAMK
jgi:tRNA threonylcarbamoyladenosine biosynthesis protein TsaE